MTDQEKTHVYSHKFFKNGSKVATRWKTKDQERQLKLLQNFNSNCEAYQLIKDLKFKEVKVILSLFKDYYKTHGMAMPRMREARKSVMAAAVFFSNNIDLLRYYLFSSGLEIHRI